MSAIAHEPRLSVIVVDERNGCVRVSVCIQRNCDFMPLVLLDKEPARDAEEAHELARQMAGMSDAQINAL